MALGGVQLPPPRVLVGIGVTVVALAVLGLRACTGGDDDTSATTTTTTSTTVVEDAPVTTTSSIVVLPDWYPKQVSRYSDREPVVTVSTLPPTSSTTTTEADFDSGATGDND